MSSLLPPQSSFQNGWKVAMEDGEAATMRRSIDAVAVRETNAAPQYGQHASSYYARSAIPIGDHFFLPTALAASTEQAYPRAFTSQRTPLLCDVNEGVMNEVLLSIDSQLATWREKYSSPLRATGGATRSLDVDLRGESEGKGSCVDASSAEKPPPPPAAARIARLEALLVERTIERDTALERVAMLQQQLMAVTSQRSSACQLVDASTSAVADCDTFNPSDTAQCSRRVDEVAFRREDFRDDIHAHGSVNEDSVDTYFPMDSIIKPVLTDRSTTSERTSTHVKRASHMSSSRIIVKKYCPHFTSRDSGTQPHISTSDTSTSASTETE